MFFSVRRSTRLSDVNRLSNVRWKKSPISVKSSEIKSTTTDPPTPSPGYSTCLLRAPWHGSNWWTYPRVVANTYILYTKATGFPLMNCLQLCLPKYGTTDLSILRFGVLEKVKYARTLSFSMFTYGCTLFILKLNKKETCKILWQIAVIRHFSQEIENIVCSSHFLNQNWLFRIWSGWVKLTNIKYILI